MRGIFSPRPPILGAMILASAIKDDGAQGFSVSSHVWGMILGSLVDLVGEKAASVVDKLWECAHGDLTSLAPHERLPEILVVPREKTPTGAAARGNP